MISCPARSETRDTRVGQRNARATSRRAQRTVGRRHIHDVKQRSVVRSRGALLRPGLSVSSHVPSLSRPPASPRGFDTSGRRDSSNSVPPMRGGWSADRRTHSFGRACDARPPCPGATGTSLGAPPWRFRMRTHEAGSRQWDRSRSDCPRQALTPGGRGPDLPRCGSRRSVGRHSLLRLSGSFLENAPLSQDVNPCTTNSIRSQ